MANISTLKMADFTEIETVRTLLRLEVGVLFKILTVVRLVDTFRSFHGTRTSFIVFKRTGHWTYFKPLHNLNPYFFMSHFNIIIILMPKVPNIVSPSGFHTAIYFVIQA
jgi:hypothetical protein